jgi:hypothetical protein
MFIPFLANHFDAAPRWTGEVKAFAVYRNIEMRPEERISTVYVARKVYEDGVTVTTIRNVTASTPFATKLRSRGAGIIERDKKGDPVLLVTRMYDRPSDRPGTYGLYHATMLAADEKLAQVAQGWERPQMPVESGYKTARIVDTLIPKVGAIDADYVLDPLEALAFGNPGGSRGDWHTPSPFLGTTHNVLDRRYSFSNPLPLTVNTVNGSNNLLVRVVTESAPGARYSYRSPSPLKGWGHLLQYPDGSLAAYVPGYRPYSVAAMLIEDKSLHPLENRSGLEIKNEGSINQWPAYVPTVVSAGEKADMLTKVERHLPFVPATPDPTGS